MLIHRKITTHRVSKNVATIRTTSEKGIIKKIFIKKSGSFSNTYLSDRTTKELYKVVNIQNLVNSTTIAYYFNNGSLILAKITTRRNLPVDLVVSSGQFYFLRDSLIKRTGNDLLTKPAFVLKNGKDFIKDWSYMQNMGAVHK